jgi:hypothetical protein
MNEEMTELAKRAVASPHWRWMPGMVTAHGYRVTLVAEAGAAGVEEGCSYPRSWGLEQWDGLGLWTSDDMLPDLTDPATLGCLLALVREALGEPLACVEVRQPGDLGCRACVRVPVGSEGWRVLQWWRASQCPIVSEIAVLVAVLEAAPEVER